MANELKLTIRTADQTRRADVMLDNHSTGADVIQGAVDNWALPADTDYSLVNVSTGELLSPRDVLDGAKVRPGDVLEVQPVLVAGVDQHF
jgi:hypothetical protein